MIQDEPKPFTVSEVNHLVNRLLTEYYSMIWVKGELSHIAKPRSGHLYFSLKDHFAELRAVFFKNNHRGIQDFKEGDEVLVSGKLAIYEPRGDFQLIVTEILPLGKGALFAKFEALKKKLENAGLFDKKHKKKLPIYPNIIAVITSKTGAAIHDILTTLQKRFPIATVHIYPSEVQGPQAPSMLIHAIERANLDHKADVIILARGGGSIEDLFAFNDEALAYAIAKSNIPIITGIGHETDFTIADFVSDFRAATPTAAASHATPSLDVLEETLQTRMKLVLQAITTHLNNATWSLERLENKLKAPISRIEQYSQTIDFLEQRLHRYINPLCHQKTALLEKSFETLQNIINMKLSETEKTLALYMTNLANLSPLATLKRGYAIATHQDHSIISTTKNISVGDTLSLILAKGELACRVLKIKE